MAPFKHDFTGVEESGNFETRLMPKAWYNVQVVEFVAKDGTQYPKEGTTKNNDPMVSLLCEVIDDQEFQGERLFYTVTFLPKDKPGAGMSKHFLKVIGQPNDAQVDVDPQTWVGEKFQAYVIEDEYKGRKKNKISDIREWSSQKDQVPF
jgi:hypothetical protein